MGSGGGLVSLALRGRDELSIEIREAVDRLTAGITDRDRIVALLHQLVADDVRYVGLEFGIGGYRPHAPAEVWENRYGDCKDKANLLRAMLKYKGITSSLALVNTEHAGLIDQKHPDYGVFNHAILAVSNEDGSLLYCDPTFAHLPAGRLGPAASNRLALLITEEGSKFVRTPAQSGGSLKVTFDLRLNLMGELEGWTSLEADGPLGAAYTNYFSSKDRRETREALVDYYGKFFEDIVLVDFNTPTLAAMTDQFSMKSYLLVPGRQGDGPSLLQFRHGWVAFPDLGDRKERETEFFQRVETVTVAYTFRLSEGWAIQGDAPRPYQAETDFVSLEGSWKSEPGAVEAVMRYCEKVNVVPLEDYLDLFNTVRSFQTWAAASVPIVRADGSPQAAARPVFRLEDFPLMPSGSGQLALVETKYPEDGNQEIRRAALEQVLQWFPEDKATRFEAGVDLAILSHNAGKAGEAAEQIRLLLKTFGASVDAYLYSWGEFHLGMCLLESNQEEQGKAILLRIARDIALTPFRRGWAYYQAAGTPQISRTEAIAILDEAVRIETPAFVDLHLRLADLLVREKDTAGLTSRLEPVLAKGGKEGHELRHRLIEQSEHWIDTGEADLARLLVASLRVLAGAAGVATEEADLAGVEQSLAGLQTYREIQEAFKKELSENPPEWWSRTTLEKFTDDQSLRKILERLNNAGRVDDYLRHRAELLTVFPAKPSSYGFDLWRMGDSLTGRYASSQLMTVLLDLLDRLPKSDRYHFEGLLLRGQILERSGDGNGALTFYRRAVEDPASQELTRLTAWRLIGTVLESRGSYREALAAYRNLEQGRDKDYWGYDCILRAIFINLALGDEDEALRLSGLLTTLDEKGLKQAESPTQIKEFATLAKDPAAAKRFWASQKTWWPNWEKVEQALGLPPLGSSLIVPVIPDLVEAGKQWGEAIRAKDTAAFLKGFRVFVHGGRWQPSMVTELSSAAYFLDGFPADIGAKILEAIVAINEGTHLEDPAQRQGIQMYLAIGYIYTNQPRKALETTSASLKEFQVDNPVRRAIIRLRGIGATQVGEQLEPAARDLEQLLGEPDLGTDRAVTVKTLALVYEKLGRTDMEIAMIEKELAHPQVKANESGHRELDGIFKRLAGARSANESFNNAMARWQATHRPAWWDFSDPKDLQDPRLADLDKVLGGDGGSFRKTEIIKIGLLVAADTTQSQERRIKGFKNAIRGMGNLAPLNTGAMELYDSVGGIKEFGTDVNRWASGMAFVYGIRAGREEETLRNYTEHPFLKQIGSGQKRALDLHKAYRHLDLESAAGIEAFCCENLGDLMLPMSRWILEDSLDSLIGLGDIGAGQRLYDRIGKFKPQSPDPSLESFRMQLLKRLRKGKEDAALRSALAAVVGTRFPPAAVAKPAIFDDIADEDLIDYLDEATIRQITLYRIKIGRFPRNEVSFWGDVRNLFDGRQDQMAAREELTRAALKNAADDQQRSSWALISVPWLDPDVPALREKYQEITRPYRKPAEHPLTYAVIRLVEVLQDMRAGEQMDMESAFANLRHPVVDMLKNEIKLNYYVVNERADLVKSILGRMPPDALLKPKDTRIMLKALELAGMKEEAAAVAEAARAELRKALVSSWAACNWGDVKKVFALAGALELESAYPREWLDHLLSETKNAKNRAWLLMSDAELRRDWKTVLVNVGVILKDSPTDYDYYRLKGVAEQHLELLPEARASLSVFADHCHDSLDRPAALAAIAEIERSLRP